MDLNTHPFTARQLSRSFYAGASCLFFVKMHSSSRDAKSCPHSNNPSFCLPCLHKFRRRGIMHRLGGAQKPAKPDTNPRMDAACMDAQPIA